MIVAGPIKNLKTPASNPIKGSASLIALFGILGIFAADAESATNRNMQQIRTVVIQRFKIVFMNDIVFLAKRPSTANRDGRASVDEGFEVIIVVKI